MHIILYMYGSLYVYSMYIHMYVRSYVCVYLLCIYICMYYTMQNSSREELWRMWQTLNFKLL